LDEMTRTDLGNRSGRLSRR